MNNEIKKIIPDLRFSEFVDDGEWEIKEVGEIFEVTRGYVLAMGLLKDTPTVEYKYPVYSSQTKHNGLAGYYNEFLYENAITWTTDGANAGDVNYREGKFYCTNVCGVLINKKGFANACIAELINSVSKKHVSYVGNPKLMNGVMGKIKIPVSKIDEQQKIASCLSSLDELITAQKEKLELLKNHKKGLMQNLFPQEGETVPKFRFPEFENDGEWKEKPLKNIFSIFQGFAFSSNDSVSYGTRWLKIADVGIQQMKEENPTFLPINFKNEYKKFLVKRGDYVLALTRPILNMELKIAKVDDIFDNALLNQRVGKIVTPNNIDFVYYLLHTKNMVVNINKNIAGNEPPNLSFQQIERILNRIPYNIEEQQKIAFCLSSLDKLISSQTAKIEKLQLHKKGLMQGLFPKIID